MTIEATLISIDETMKALLACVQSGAQMTATAEPAPARAPRTKKADVVQPDEDIVEGDPSGTKYFVNADLKTVFAKKPDDIEPLAADGFTPASSKSYLAAKAEFAKKQPGTTPAPTPSPPAEPSTAPAATPAAGSPSASTATTSASEVTFQQVAAAMVRLNKGTEPTQGRAGILAVLKQYLPDEASPKVPMLEMLGKHAEILQSIEALLVPAEDDLGI